MAYTFDCATKIIQLTDTSTLDMQDLYSRWKDAVLSVPMISGCAQAFRVVKEPTVGGQFVGPYYFSMNDWQIRPFDTNHDLNVVGTLYADESMTLSLFKTSDLMNIVHIIRTVAVEVFTTETGVSGLTAPESAKLFAVPTATEIAQEVILDYTF